MSRKIKTILEGSLQDQALAFGFHGIIDHWDQLSPNDLEFLPRLFNWELEAIQHRSLERRIKSARLGSFKPLPDFDWAWPTRCDRPAIEALFIPTFLSEGANIVLVGPNGVGKTMFAKNISFQALRAGHTVRFVTASQMLNELAAQDSARTLEQRLRAYVSPDLLSLDELGYLSYGNRHADLLFEVISRRYEAHRSVLVTTNKPFAEWKEIFPNAGCVVTLVDRLVHRAEIIAIEGSSYRLKEARERQERRGGKREGPPSVRP
jgi:DNA replication protein DnaC